MKNKEFKNALFLMLIILNITSCTIQKRSFNRGYHIEWKSKFNTESNESVGTENLNSSQKNMPAGLILKVRMRP